MTYALVLLKPISTSVAITSDILYTRLGCGKISRPVDNLGTPGKQVFVVIILIAKNRSVRFAANCSLVLIALYFFWNIA